MHKDNCRTTKTCNSNNNNNRAIYINCLVCKMSYVLYNSYTWTIHLKYELISALGLSVHLSEKLTELSISSETGRGWGISDLRVHHVWKVEWVVHFIWNWEGYIWSEDTPHLKSWVSCSLHLKPGGISDLRVHHIWKVEWVVHFIWNWEGYIWSEDTPHLKSWVSCSLHLKTRGVYLIWGYTTSEKLSKLFPSPEIGGYIWSDHTLITEIYIYIYIYIYICQVWCSGMQGIYAQLRGVHLPWVYETLFYIYRSAMRCAKFVVVVFKASILNWLGGSICYGYMCIVLYIYIYIYI